MGMLQVRHPAKTPCISAHTVSVSEAWEGCLGAPSASGALHAVRKGPCQRHNSGSCMSLES